MSPGDFLLKDPWWLLSLLVWPLVLWLRSRQPVAAVVMPFAGTWWRPTLLVQPARLPALLLGAGLVVLALGLARPQRLVTLIDPRQEGHEVMLAIDLSGSMLAEDFELNGERINRLDVIKPVIKEFIARRPNDRIGLVVFAGRAYTLSPPTFDHRWLAEQVERLRIGIIEDGTAIGDGLGVALSRLEHPKPLANKAGPGQAAEKINALPGKPTPRFVVLLSDGANNKGLLKPNQSAAVAKARGITVYTIGAGKDGLAPFPILDAMGAKIGYRRILADLDEPGLRQVAEITGGQYFRVDNTEAVAASFRAIDESERTQFKTQIRRPHDLFRWFLAGGLALLLGGVWLASAAERQELTA
jgi:Ca-activated chloride channel homolog